MLLATYSVSEDREEHIVVDGYGSGRDASCVAPELVGAKPDTCIEFHICVSGSV